MGQLRFKTEEVFILLQPKEFSDVKFYCRSQLGQGPNTNVPRAFRYAKWMLWGYMGDSTMDFSINILYHFTGGDEDFARNYAHDFLEEVVSMLPEDTCGVLKARSILNWILPRKEGLIPPYHKKVTWIDINPDYEHGDVGIINKKKRA